MISVDCDLITSHILLQHLLNFLNKKIYQGLLGDKTSYSNNSVIPKKLFNYS